MDDLDLFFNINLTARKKSDIELFMEELLDESNYSKRQPPRFNRGTTPKLSTSKKIHKGPKT